jgi:GntR family histidine utilization transcriptional repressor
MDPTIPRYQQLKAHILEGIQAGRLRPRDRVPSEQELVHRFGVSRMTAHRALRELASDGIVVRQSGVGTFVAPRPAHSDALQVRNIADEIRARGHQHGARVVTLEKVAAGREVAGRLRLRPGADVFHSLVVHLEDGLPIQAEDRWVCAHTVPGYAEQDFTATTPNEYLSRVAPLQTAEHRIRAERPARRVSALLRMAADEPCLVIHRRTWSAGRPVTIADLYHPGSRYELTAGAPPGDATTPAPERARTRRSSR